MARKFTQRQNGKMMTTIMAPFHFTVDQYQKVCAAARKLGVTPADYIAVVCDEFLEEDYERDAQAQD